jgi:hypothetical protein
VSATRSASKFGKKDGINLQVLRLPKGLILLSEMAAAILKGC